VKVAATLVVVAAVLGAGFVFLHGIPERSGGGGDAVQVTHASLQPGRIVLTLESHADKAVAIAQAIVNDAYVNFAAGTPGAADIAIDYPWIEGESYEIELLTSTGSSVDFELEDAGEAS
jgi:zinc transporter, ZIP family